MIVAKCINEDLVLNVIDELWSVYDGELWFRKMVEAGTAGTYLRQQAIEKLENA